MASSEPIIIEERIKVYVRLKPVNNPQTPIDATGNHHVDDKMRSVKRNELSAKIIAEELSPIERLATTENKVGITDINIEDLGPVLDNNDAQTSDDTNDRLDSQVVGDDLNFSNRTLNKTVDQLAVLREDEHTRPPTKIMKVSKATAQSSQIIVESKQATQDSTHKEILFRKEKENVIMNLKSGDVYEYESAFDGGDTNRDLFNKIIKPNFEYILDGNNFSVFMYGQTNSGKTFTMRGPGKNAVDEKTKNAVKDGRCCSGSKSVPKSHVERSFNFESSLRKNEYVLDGKNSKGNVCGSAQKKKQHTFKCDEAEQNEGCVQKTLKYLFKTLNSRSDCNYKAQVSYYEIYNENVYDLLNTCDLPLEIRESKEGRPVINNLKVLDINSYDEAIKAYEFGENRRQFAATSMNHNSSRSHVVLQLRLEIRYKARPYKSYHSNIILADLAGSECIGRSAKDPRFKEGTSINKSLLYLSNLIKKLNKGTQNVSFRESKLTRILQPALTGNSRTAVICTLNPLDEFYAESLNTLRFGISAGGVKLKIKQHDNKAKEERSEQVNVLKSEVEELRSKYAALAEDSTERGIEAEFYKSRLIALESELESINLYVANLESSHKELREHNEFLQTQIAEINKLKQSCEASRVFATTSTVRELSAYKSSRKEQPDAQTELQMQKLVEENKCLRDKVTRLEFHASFKRDVAVAAPLAVDGFKAIKKINCSPAKEELAKWNKQLARKVNKLEAEEEKRMIVEKKLKNMVVEKNSEILKLRKMLSSKHRLDEARADEDVVFN